MARFQVQTDREYILFSEGSLPSPDAMLGNFPRARGPPIPLDEMPEDNDEKRAWLFTLHAYQVANLRGYDRTVRPPLATWIIGRPRGPPALLAPWFEGQGEDYRLLVHRFPLSDAGSRESRRFSHDCWTETYRRLGVRRRPMPRTEMAAPVMMLLDQVLLAYQEDPSRLPDLLCATGHAFAGSTGPTTGYNRRLWARS